MARSSAIVLPGRYTKAAGEWLILLPFAKTARASWSIASANLKGLTVLQHCPL